MSVNARRILNAIRDADHVLNDPGAGGLIDPFGDLQICELTTSAAESRTLANPTKAGIRLTLRMKTDGGDCTITVGNGVNVDGDTQAVFANVGDQLELISVSTEIGFRWEVLVNAGPAALSGGVTQWTFADLPADIATEYFAAIVANGGTISAGNQAAVLGLLEDLQAAGILRRMIAVYLYHGNTLNAARLNVMTPGTWPGAWPITWTGTPTLNASGGFTPTAVNYGSALHPDLAGLTELHGGGLGFYSTSNAASGEYSMGLFSDFYLAPKEGTGAYYRLSGTFVSAGANQDLSGFHFACRERNSSTIRAYRNGTNYSTVTRAFSEGFGTSTADYMRVGGMLDGVTHYPSTTPIRLSLVTEGLTTTEVGSLNTAIVNYIGALA